MNEPIIYSLIVQDGASSAFDNLTGKINQSGEAGTRAAARIAGGLKDVYEQAAATNRQVVSLKSQLEQLHKWNAGGGSGANTGPLGPMSSGQQPFQAIMQGWSSMGDGADRATTKLKSLDTELKQKPKDAGAASSALQDLWGKLSNFAVGILEYKALQLLTQSLQALEQEIANTVVVAAQLETLRRSFASLEGSVKEGDAYLSKIRQTSYETASSFADVAKAAEQLTLAGVGQEKALQIITSLRGAIAAAGGTTEDYNGALRAMVQVQNKGVLQSEELVRQFSNRQTPAIMIAASALHETTGQFLADVKAGKVSASEFFDAFIAGSQRFQPALEASRTSFEGVSTNLQNLRSEFEATFGQSVKNELVSSLNDLFLILRDPEVKLNLALAGKVFGDLAAISLRTLDGWLRLFQLLNNATQSLEILANITNIFAGQSRGAADEQARLNSAVGDGAAAFTQTTSALFDYKQALTDLANAQDRMQRAEQLLMRSYDDKINALQRQNELLQQQKQLEDYLANLGKAQSQYAKDRAAAANILFSSGRSARDRLGDDAANIAKAQRDIYYAQVENQNKDSIYSLQSGKTAAERLYQDNTYALSELTKAITALGSGGLAVGSPLYNQYRQYSPPPGGLTAPGVAYDSRLAGTSWSPDGGYSWSSAPGTFDNSTIRMPGGRGGSFGSRSGGSFGGNVVVPINLQSLDPATAARILQTPSARQAIGGVITDLLVNR